MFREEGYMDVDVDVESDATDLHDSSRVRTRAPFGTYQFPHKQKDGFATSWSGAGDAPVVRFRCVNMADVVLLRHPQHPLLPVLHYTD
jgi:hypothetical protein